MFVFFTNLCFYIYTDRWTDEQADGWTDGLTDGMNIHMWRDERALPPSGPMPKKEDARLDKLRPDCIGWAEARSAGLRSDWLGWGQISQTWGGMDGQTYGMNVHMWWDERASPPSGSMPKRMTFVFTFTLGLTWRKLDCFSQKCQMLERASATVRQTMIENNITIENRKH
jgi:hypothetical protein